MVKKRCDICSGFEGYPRICNYCSPPKRQTTKPSKKNNFYVELEFMILYHDENIKETIANEISKDYLRVILDNADVGRIHYKGKLSNLCFKVFHLEYGRQIRSIKESLPKNKLFDEDTLDGIKELAHTRAKDYLEITIINMIEKVNKKIKKRENLKNKKIKIK